MGRFNRTGCFSQTALRYNQLIYCFLAVEHDFMLTPLGFPIKGAYNDYGNIEPNHTSQNLFNKLNINLNKELPLWYEADFDNWDRETIESKLPKIGQMLSSLQGEYRLRLLMDHRVIFKDLIKYTNTFSKVYPEDGVKSEFNINFNHLKNELTPRWLTSASFNTQIFTRLTPVDQVPRSPTGHSLYHKAVLEYCKIIRAMDSLSLMFNKSPLAGQKDTYAFMITLKSKMIQLMLNHGNQDNL